MYMNNNIVKTSKMLNYSYFVLHYDTWSKSSSYSWKGDWEFSIKNVNISLKVLVKESISKANCCKSGGPN